MQRTYAALAALLVLVFLIFMQGIGPFYLFDSLVALEKNRFLSFDAKVFDQWRTAILSSGSGILRRPVSMFSFALESALAGGMHPALSKTINVFLHLVNGILVFLLATGIQRIVRRGHNDGETYDSGWRRRESVFPLLACAVWLLHPLHVSTVHYAVQRMSLLAALFALMSAVTYLRWRIDFHGGISETRQNARALVLVGFFAILSMLSKENGIVVMPLLALLEVLLFSARNSARAINIKAFAIAALVLPWLAILLGLIAGEHFPFAGQYKFREFDAWERLLTQIRVLWLYINWLIFPDISAMGIHHDAVEVSRGLLRPGATLLAALAWFAMAVLLWLFRKRYPIVVLGVAWFIYAHLVESTILPLELVYEHRNYLPSVGLALAIAWAITGVAGMLSTRVRWSLIAGSVLLVLVPGLLRNALWSDELTLAQVNALNHPESGRSVYHSARLHLDRAESAVSRSEKSFALKKAHSGYQQMLALDPDDLVPLITLYYMDARWNRGANGSALGAVITQQMTRFEFKPQDNNALLLMIQCHEIGYCKNHQILQGALEARNTAFPEAVRTYLMLGRFYTRVTYNQDQAIHNLREAATRAGNSQAHMQLAADYVRLGDPGMASEMIQTAIGKETLWLGLSDYLAAFESQ